MTVALWPSLRRLGFRWRLRFDWRHETVRRLLHLARWVVVYVVANQIAYFIIIRLSGRIPVEGAYVVYSHAFIFFSLPHAIVAVSIFTALLPGMSARWTDRHIGGVRELFSRGLRDTEIAMIPAAAGYAVLAGPIVELVASYGHMAPANTALLGRTLAAFAIGLPFFSAFQFLTRTFYATQDAKTPALANIAVAVVNLGGRPVARLRARIWAWSVSRSATRSPTLAGTAILYASGPTASRGRRRATDPRNDHANAGRLGPDRGGRVGRPPRGSRRSSTSRARSCGSSRWPSPLRPVCLPSRWAPLSSGSRRPMRSGRP